MILTGRDIQWYIETKKLVIDPVLPEQFQQNGIDLILDRATHPPSGFGWAPSSFEKGEFYLGATRERIEMPDDLMAFVQLRSTWARRGILLPPTVVDAGFKGNLTLEILAAAHLMAPYGQRFAHLIFARLSGPADPYRGKYQDQSGITNARPD